MAVLILGAAGGIGSALARALAARGRRLPRRPSGSSAASWVTGQVVGVDGGLASVRSRS